MSKVYLIPIFACIVTQATFSGILWLSHHNDGSTNTLESCIFSQLINMCSVLIGIVVYLRHRQVNEIILSYDYIENFVMIENEIATWLGYGSSLGLSVAANFHQLNSSMVYYIGGFIWLSFGAVYTVLQGYVSFYISSYIASKYMAFLRMAVGFLYAFFLFAALSSSCAVVRFYGTAEDLKGCTSFDALFKWIAAAFFNIFLLSFLREFADI